MRCKGDHGRRFLARARRRDQAWAGKRPQTMSLGQLAPGWTERPADAGDRLAARRAARRAQQR